MVFGQGAGALAVQDHIQSGAVLDRAAGIEKLGFGVDFDARQVFVHLGQADQRRIADLAQQRMRRLDGCFGCYGDHVVGTF